MQGNSFQNGPRRLTDVVCVQSVPRLGFTAHYATAVKTLLPLGINLHVMQGAYWHHVISDAMHQHMDDGTQFVLANDYDTPILRQHVLGLYDIIAQHPDMDSIQGVQVKRNTTQLMYRVRISENQIRMPAPDDSKEDLIKIVTGHFGLTLIRVSALKKLSLPWMYEVPDADGFWSDQALQPDIAFWHNMEAAGCQCWQANRILLPHINEFIMSPAPDFSNVVMQTYESFEKNGLPREGEA